MCYNDRQTLNVHVARIRIKFPPVLFCTDNGNESKTDRDIGTSVTLGRLHALVLYSYGVDALSARAYCSDDLSRSRGRNQRDGT